MRGIARDQFLVMRGDELLLRTTRAELMRARLSLSLESEDPAHLLISVKWELRHGATYSIMSPAARELLYHHVLRNRIIG